MTELSEIDKIQLARTPIRTNDQLWNAFAGLFNLRIPRTKVCEHCDAPFDAVASAFFAHNPNDIWIGNRGGGKSLMLSGLVSLELVNLMVNINLIGGSKEQAEQIIKYMRREDSAIQGKLWDAPNAPRGLIKNTDTKSRIQTIDDPPCEVLALAAAATSVRSKHPCRLRFDEADVADQKVVDDSYGLTVDRIGAYGETIRAQSVFSSTYHTPRGTMWALLQRAKREGIRVWRWCYKECMVSNGGWLTPDFIGRKKRDVPPERWAIEFENVEPSGGQRVWNRSAVEKNFYRELGNCEGGLNEWYRAWPGRPPRDRRYYHGADWATKADDTVLTTLTEVSKDDDRLQCAAWYRTGKADWDVILQDSVEHFYSYSPGGLVHDATTYGQTMHDFIKNHDLLKADVRRKKFGLDGINFSARRRIMEIMLKYQKAIETGDALIFPWIQFLVDAHVYLTDDQLRGAAHIPDAIVSAFLAYESWCQFRKSGLHVPPQMLVIRND